MLTAVVYVLSVVCYSYFKQYVDPAANANVFAVQCCTFTEIFVIYSACSL
jgi:hypothetical protein